MFSETWSLEFGTSFQSLHGLSVSQLCRSHCHYRVPGMETGKDFHFVADTFAGLHEMQLRVLVRDYEDNLQLSALHDCRYRHAQRIAQPNWHKQPGKLARTQSRLC